MYRRSVKYNTKGHSKVETSKLNQNEMPRLNLLSTVDYS